MKLNRPSKMPSVDELLLPILSIHADGCIHKVQGVREILISFMHLPKDVVEFRGTKNQYVLADITHTSTMHLYYAGLINRVENGYHYITPEGMELLKKDLPELSRKILWTYKKYLNYYATRRSVTYTKESLHRNLIRYPEEINKYLNRTPRYPQFISLDNPLRKLEEKIRNKYTN